MLMILSVVRPRRYLAKYRREQNVKAVVLAITVKHVPPTQLITTIAVTNAHSLRLYTAGT